MNLRKKAWKEQKNLAVALSELAGVPLDRPASLNDVRGSHGHSSYGGECSTG